MSGNHLSELELLLGLASLQADRARAEIAGANSLVVTLTAAIADLSPFPDNVEPAAGLMFEKWLTWRDTKSLQLHKELALARADVARDTGHAARVIAREEVLKSLLADAIRSQRDDLNRHRVEALVSAPTSPGGQYR